MPIKSNIKELINLEFLQLRLCSKCENQFTEVEYKEDNWLVFFRDNHGLQSKLFPQNDYRGFIGVELHLQHKECGKVYSNQKVQGAKREIKEKSEQSEQK